MGLLRRRHLSVMSRQQSSTERTCYSVQLNLTFYFSIDFEEVSIHVFLSRLSWTIFVACQVRGLKPSFRKLSRRQWGFYTRDSSHPAARQHIRSQKQKGKPSTRACSSWHHTASFDNRSGVTRDPRRTGSPRKMAKYTRRGPAASHRTQCSSWTLRDLPLPCLPAAPPDTGFQTWQASPN